VVAGKRKFFVISNCSVGVVVPIPTKPDVLLILKAFAKSEPTVKNVPYASPTPMFHNELPPDCICNVFDTPEPFIYKAPPETPLPPIAKLVVGFAVPMPTFKLVGSAYTIPEVLKFHDCV
jgi:hypothetical protein